MSLPTYKCLVFRANNGLLIKTALLKRPWWKVSYSVFYCFNSPSVLQMKKP